MPFLHQFLITIAENCVFVYCLYVKLLINKIFYELISSGSCITTNVLCYFTLYYYVQNSTVNYVTGTGE